MAALPPIYWKTFIAAPIERVFDTLTTATGWDGWFTHGSSIDERELVMRWQDVAKIGHRVTLWDGHDGELRCPIIARERPTRFAFQWRSGERPTTVETSGSRRAATARSSRSPRLAIPRQRSRRLAASKKPRATRSMPPGGARRSSC